MTAKPVSSPPAPTTSSSSTTLSGAQDASSTDFLQLLINASLSGQTQSAVNGQSLTEIETPSDTESGTFEDGSVNLAELLAQALAPAQPRVEQTTQATNADEALLIHATNARSVGAASADITADAALLQAATSNISSETAAALADPSLLGSTEATQIGDLQGSNAQHFTFSPLHASSPSQLTQQPSTEIRSPVGTPAWADELGNQITWMAQNGRQSATLSLTPEELGPIEIRIAVHEKEASVWFGAAHSETRSALEQALPRLRELFAGQGLTLADSGVFHEAPRQQTHTNSFSGSQHTHSDESVVSTVTHVAHGRRGLVDTYA